MWESNNLAGVVVGGFLGIAGAISSGVLLQIWQDRQKRINLRSALAGELRAILTVVDERRVLPALENVIDHIRMHQTVLFFPVWLGDMHNLVFRQNADKLGSLPAPLPERVVAVHYRIGSVALELQMLFEASQGRGGWLGEQWRSSWQRCLQQHEHVFTLADEVRGVTAEVINELEGV
jgi:hypothetical protein